MTRVAWHYFRAGTVERGPRYELRDGYAHRTLNGVEYPWLTKREAQSAAKRANARAVFHADEKAARRALELDVAEAGLELSKRMFARWLRESKAVPR